MTPMQLHNENLITFEETIEEIGRRWVTTWHLTPVRNLTSIAATGLQPYPLAKPYFPYSGIWLWAEPLEGTNLHWTVIQRMIDNETDEVALLSVRTRLSWTWLTERSAYIGMGDEIGLVSHSGTMHGRHNTFDYHVNFPARIALQPIPFHYMKVERIYHLQGVRAAP